MPFDFNNRNTGTEGGSAFDNGPAVPKRPQGKRGGFHIPERDVPGRRNDMGRVEPNREPSGCEMQSARNNMLDHRGNRRSGVRRSGVGVDIPWTMIIYVLLAILVVVLLVVFWDVIYALMVNILSFLLLLIIFLAILRFLLRR